MRQRVVNVTCDGCGLKDTVDAEHFFEQGMEVPKVPVGWTYDRVGRHLCDDCTNDSIAATVSTSDISPTIVCLCGDAFPTLQGMADHLSMVHDAYPGAPDLTAASERLITHLFVGRRFSSESVREHLALVEREAVDRANRWPVGQTLRCKLDCVCVGERAAGTCPRGSCSRCDTPR